MWYLSRLPIREEGLQSEPWKTPVMLMVPKGSTMPETIPETAEELKMDGLFSDVLIRFLLPLIHFEHNVDLFPSPTKSLS